MASKAGRPQMKDIRQGRTFWDVVIPANDTPPFVSPIKILGTPKFDKKDKRHYRFKEVLTYRWRRGKNEFSIDTDLAFTLTGNYQRDILDSRFKSRVFTSRNAANRFLKDLEEFIAKAPRSLHHTVGIYPSRDYISNAVLNEHLLVHIDYNITMRPGRMLIVDDRIIYRGNTDHEYGLKVIDKFKRYPMKMSHPTTPYQ